MIEKYINFPDHPFFTPMYNPGELLEGGVAGGTLEFVTLNPANYLKLNWSSLAGKVGSHSYVPDINKYEVISDHTNMYPILKGISIHKWIEWYIAFYYKRRKPSLDNQMIYFWYTYILKIFESPIDERSKQTLFEMAWNWNFKPNFNILWMQNRYPLETSNPPT